MGNVDLIKQKFTNKLLQVMQTTTDKPIFVLFPLRTQHTTWLCKQIESDSTRTIFFQHYCHGRLVLLLTLPVPVRHVTR